MNGDLQRSVNVTIMFNTSESSLICVGFYKLDIIF